MKPLDPRLLRYASATRWFIAASVVLGAISALLLVAQAFLISGVVVAVFQDGAGVSDITVRLLALLAVTAGRAVVAWATTGVGHRAGAQAVSQLRTAMMARLMQLGPSFLSGQRVGELVALSTRGVSALEDYFAGYLPQLVLAVLVPLIVGTAILTQDLLSAVIVALTVPIIPVFMILIGRYTQSRVDRQWATLGVLSGHFLDVVAGLPTLKLFGRTRAAAQTIRTVGEQYRVATMGVLRVSFLSALVLELLATLSVAIIAVAIGLRLVNGTLDLRTGLAVLIMAPEVYLPLRMVGLQFHAAAEGLGAAERMFEVLEAQSPPRGTRTVADLSDRTIAVRDLSVHFGDRVGLWRATFVVPPGQVTALVGPSGAGKSTILGVLMGLVGPPSAAISGEIVLTGADGEIPLAQLDPDAWRARIGYVPQAPAMLVGTVASNVRIGRPDATQEEVASALRAAGLDPGDLRDGLATAVGEGGSGLSVGQARRVGVARALVRAPELYLLDEPTAALDLNRESELAATVGLLAKQGRTVLVVTHRPAVIELADHVVRLQLPPQEIPDRPAGATAESPVPGDVLVAP